MIFGLYESQFLTIFSGVSLIVYSRSTDLFFSSPRFAKIYLRPNEEWEYWALAVVKIIELFKSYH